mmetsp:Transcript_19677/g.24263  ORF Transcript_19677/g.24263 Transcript_19677/m.24263 type:complete len:550 (-) Transcript_19677:205-1854(-)
MNLLECFCPTNVHVLDEDDNDDDSSAPKTILTQSPSKPRSSIHDSILETIGRTPIVCIPPHSKTNPTESNIYLKLESENPGGSVKDRLSLAVIEWAEQSGKLEKGQTVVEASSGNTGIGMAMVCAKKGYPYVCVMAESFSIERRKLMRFLGAKVILTNPAHKGTGMVIKAKELADTHGYFWPNQFENEANAWIHEKTTGPEILNAFRKDSLQIDHFVCSYGTGGTLLGIGNYLRKHSPATKIHVCEPSNAPMLFSEIPTNYPPKEGSDDDDDKKYPSTSFDVPHPVWRPHLLQGWATDFIPKLVASATERKVYDSVLHVGGSDAIQAAQSLALNEGILSGTSGGGTLSAALKFAKTLSESSNIVVMIADTGERYLSTPLFENIPTDMTEEEKEIANSTPSTPPPPPGLPDATKEAEAWVKNEVKTDPIVIFSLEYCEFCWTLTSFFDALGVSYHKIDIDNFMYAKDNIGNQYRAALSEWTDCKTFPQFFVDGVFVGGALDACMMWKKEELQKLLKKAGVKGGNDVFNNYDGDPFEFLPKWMTQNPLRTK